MLTRMLRKLVQLKERAFWTGRYILDIWES